MTELKCPRCDGKEFWDRDCGPDSWDDDIYYLSYVCKKCELWFDGWVDDWLILKDGTNVKCWQETEGAIPYRSSQQMQKTNQKEAE